ncbi:DUF6074 family protein [Pararhizobium gei]|uniref:DUF6074 family protein n=1 Tax=Pararhizobium gei TaxID=1395951 RepID=UPI0023DBA663|nr:DUF6074 family protein [Rhizobium gei]
MKKEDDTPLLRFDFRPPPCQVIVFPIAARIGKARHIAEKLESRKTYDQRQSYWKLVQKNLIDELTKRGLSQEEIAAEVQALHDAVQAEMQKNAARANQSPRPTEWDDGPRRA